MSRRDAKLDKAILLFQSEVSPPGDDLLHIKLVSSEKDTGMVTLQHVFSQVLSSEPTSTNFSEFHAEETNT